VGDDDGAVLVAGAAGFGAGVDAFAAVLRLSWELPSSDGAVEAAHATVSGPRRVAKRARVAKFDVIRAPLSRYPRSVAGAAFGPGARGAFFASPTL
jgi:hypothetical protein